MKSITIKQETKRKQKMKKLMIMMALVASCYGTFGACSEATPDRCYLWDVTFTLKTLAPKAAKCGSCSTCGEVADPSYYLNGTTRKIKGYLWSCEYSCDTWNIVLWDEKNKVALIPLDSSGTNQTTVSADDALVYGKKANKACASFLISGDEIEIMACGMNGKLTRKNGVDSYVQSLSGKACGNIAYVKPNTYKNSKSGGSLCDDTEPILLGSEYVAKCLTWCDAGCFDNWCEDGDESPDMVPCEGTWSIKFNKKLAEGKKGSIYNLVPAYAR
jgi:hypothetical protein